MSDAAGRVRVSPEEGEEGLDSHQVKQGGEGAALPDAIRSAREGAKMAIEVEADRVVIVEHGDDSGKRGVKTEGEEDLPEETPIDTIVGL